MRPLLSMCVVCLLVCIMVWGLSVDAKYDSGRIPLPGDPGNKRTRLLKHVNQCICAGCCNQCSLLVRRQRAEELKERIRSYYQARRRLQDDYYDDYFDDPFGFGEIIKYYREEISWYNNTLHFVVDIARNSSSAFDVMKSYVFSEVQGLIDGAKEEVDDAISKYTDPFGTLKEMFEAWLAGALSFPALVTMLI